MAGSRKLFAARSRDLFDDTTMSFGEHLEVLRVHVFRALVGVILSVIACLCIGDRIFAVMRGPIEQAMADRGVPIKLENDLPKESLLKYFQRLLRGEPTKTTGDAGGPGMVAELQPDQLRVTVRRSELERQGLRLQNTTTNSGNTDSGNTDSSNTDSSNSDSDITLILRSREFAQLRRLIRDSTQVTTLKAEEGFVTYIKVCSIAGLLLASPWVFYQLWLFVAAGLHPHERKYMYVYLPMSLGLFLAGAMAGFFFAFPMMLQFFISFNDWLGIYLQPRLSEYISLALLMPLMFCLSFQLPLVMLFLERIGIFTVQNYRDNYRVAILVISILAAVLTTSPDPYSMILMGVPLVLLYEVGIQLCGLRIKTPALPIR